MESDTKSVTKSRINENNNEDNDYSKDNSKENTKYVNKSLYNNLTVENGPKLSQNAQKLKDLEDKMSSLEDVLKDIKGNLQRNEEEKTKNKEEIREIYQETKEIHDNLNINLSEKVKQTFFKEFDTASRLVVEHENRKNEMESQNYEFNNLIKELDNNNYALIVKNRKIEEQLSDLKNEYEYLKEGYDELANQNSIMRKENLKKDEKICNLENELNDMKNVVSKLTEIRVILNKYFSSHFENFTPNERKIIQDVGVPLGSNNNTKKIENYKENNYKSSYTAANNYPPINKTDQISNDNAVFKNNKKILNEEEYKLYQTNQKKMKNKTPNDTPPSRTPQNKEMNLLYNNPEDDFWYQTNKNK